MAREVFPTIVDRDLIVAWLRGIVVPGDTDVLTVEGSVVRVMGHPSLFIDHDGSLRATLDTDTLAREHFVRLVNFVSEVLGMPERRVVREIDDTGATRTMKFFYGDEPITPGVPIVIAGGLGLSAWREVERARGRA
jgi:hypothetical protein